MDRITRYRGGSSVWTDQTVVSTIINTEFFGITTPLQNKFWIKISGVWKECITWIKIGGVWKQSSPKIKIDGIWK